MRAMSSINARASGQFTIGDTTINRLGYGAMRLTGPYLRSSRTARSMSSLIPSGW